MAQLHHLTKEVFSTLMLISHNNSHSNFLTLNSAHLSGIQILKMDKFVKKCLDQHNGFLIKKFKKSWKQLSVCWLILISQVLSICRLQKNSNRVHSIKKQKLLLKSMHYQNKKRNKQIELLIQSIFYSVKDKQDLLFWN